jgi:DNA-binding HxlR family transcriptional regulator
MAKSVKNKKKQAKELSNPLSIPSESHTLVPLETSNTSDINHYEIKADKIPIVITHEEPKAKLVLTAQELLDKPLEELEKDIGKREAHNLLKKMKIITAIMLGKNRNKELAKVLDTDKSFMSKQIKSLEEEGLVKKEGSGKETKYEVDRFNVMKFLESTVVIKWSKTQKDNAKGEENGRAEKSS